MKNEEYPYPFTAVKGGTIIDMLTRAEERIARMEAALKIKQQTDSDSGFEGARIYKQEKMLKSLKIFLPFENRFTVIDDNRLRFDKGVIFPKTCKVKFNSKKTIYEYKQQTMLKFLESLPVINAQV